MYNETIELCKKLKELHWIGWENPEALKENIDGYAWICLQKGTILEEWIPNPGRRALVQEVKKMLGDEEFEKQIAKGAEPHLLHQLFSHENWMKIWILLKGRELNK